MFSSPFEVDIGETELAASKGFHRDLASYAVPIMQAQHLINAYH